MGRGVGAYKALDAVAVGIAIKRMEEQAEAMEANAIGGMRFTTSMVMGGVSEILAYGTAVVEEDWG